MADRTPRIASEYITRYVFMVVAVALLVLTQVSEASGQLITPGDLENTDPTAPTGVRINHAELDQRTVSALQSQLGTAIAPGDYWYDGLSGLYGVMGGPGLGFTVPGLELGAPLPANASGGGTSVFVNGRELHPMDVAALMPLVGPVMPGRYWLRYDGFYGVEGGPALGNLMVLAQQRAGGGGYNRTAVGGHIGSDGQSSFYLDPGTGCSVMPGSGVSC